MKQLNFIKSFFKKLFWFLVFLGVILGSGLVLDLVFSRGTWVCEDGEWVKYGRPRQVEPDWDCELKEPEESKAPINREEEQVGPGWEGEWGSGLLPFPLENPSQGKADVLEESRLVAWNFVVNLPDYKKAGFAINLDNVEQIGAGRFVFDFSFLQQGQGAERKRIRVRVEELAVGEWFFR